MQKSYEEAERRENSILGEYEDYINNFQNTQSEQPSVYARLYTKKWNY